MPNTNTEVKAKAGAGNENAGAGSEEITAGQLAHQLAQGRREASSEGNNLSPADEESEGAAQGEDGTTGAGESEAASEAGGPDEAPDNEGAPEGATDSGDENDDGDGGEADTDVSPETQARINKRIGKEVGKRKALEEENARLKAELAAAGKGPAAAAEPEELTAPREGTRPTARGSAYGRQLQDELREARANYQWARHNPDGGTVPGPEGKEYTFSAEQAAAIEAKALEDMGRLGARMETFQQEKGRNHQVLKAAARAEYPQMFQKGTAENGLAKRLLEDFPELAGLPGGELAIGDIVAATMGRIAKAGGQRSEVRGQRSEVRGQGEVKPQVKLSARPTRVVTGGGNAPGNGRVTNGNGNGKGAGELSYAGATSVEELAKSFGRNRSRPG